MKKIIKIARKAVQMVLSAPVKLPAKVVQVSKYIALVLGIIETTMPDKDPETKHKEEGQTDEDDR